MHKRPLSVTIIAWFLIVTSLFNLFSILTMANNSIVAKMLAESPLPHAVHQAFGIASTVIALICGYGILKGFNWARFLYLAAGVLGLVFNVVTVPMISVIVMGIVMLAVIAFFLFRPEANAWFERSAATDQ